MNTATLLASCKQSGVTIRLEGDRLKVAGDEAAVTKLLPILKAHKQDLLALLTELERDFFEERAAIAEFDGGLSRSKAEAFAMAELEHWRKTQTYH